MQTEAANRQPVKVLATRRGPFLKRITRGFPASNFVALTWAKEKDLNAELTDIVVLNTDYNAEQLVHTAYALSGI